MGYPRNRQNIKCELVSAMKRFTFVFGNVKDLRARVMYFNSPQESLEDFKRQLEMILLRTEW